MRRLIVALWNFYQALNSRTFKRDHWKVFEMVIKFYYEKYFMTFSIVMPHSLSQSIEEEELKPINNGQWIIPLLLIYPFSAPTPILCPTGDDEKFTFLSNIWGHTYCISHLACSVAKFLNSSL